jgi:hypothetical protein
MSSSKDSAESQDLLQSKSLSQLQQQQEQQEQQQSGQQQQQPSQLGQQLMNVRKRTTIPDAHSHAQNNSDSAFSHGIHASIEGIVLQGSVANASMSGGGSAGTSSSSVASSGSNNLLINGGSSSTNINDNGHVNDRSIHHLRTDIPPLLLLNASSDFGLEVDAKRFFSLLSSINCDSAHHIIQDTDHASIASMFPVTKAKGIVFDFMLARGAIMGNNENGNNDINHLNNNDDGN